MDITNEILEQLEEFSLSASEEILLKMKEFCFAYNCTAEHIVDTWVAFSATKKCDMQPTLGMLDHMEKEVLMKNSNKSAKNRKSVTTPVYNSASIDLISDERYDISDKSNRRNSATVKKSPIIFSPNSLTPTCFTPSRKFASRTGAGEVVCSFGDTQNVGWKLSDEFSCSIIPYNEKTILQDSYHFMCEKLRDRASILNDMIQDAAQYFEGKYDIHEWGHIQLPSVETVSVIGRICSDGSGRLTASSLLLEGSQEMCSGAIMPLDVSRLESFSLFPGQIIAGTGINSLGKKIILNNIYEGVFPLPSPEAPDLANCFDSLNVVVAAGPFATSDSLSYEPLNDLMKYVRANLPHVVILIGPLVDINNDLIEKGDLNETYDELFQNLIAEILKHIESSSTKVVLVPSIKDAHHDFVYPTPPYKTKMLTKVIFFL
ncbi:DNA polymerase alpha subunit B-like [Stegodyphus dumicola]|uniref:DNA polymerase alpha subunit B-like n=1 Tax=Stegodyphus dumicola TaxID=202533 RepID=UPI0015AE2115|nr:DNA polymerase alpha subunit B-like [Stegodyphus dumicola]